MRGPHLDLPRGVANAQTRLKEHARRQKSSQSFPQLHPADTRLPVLGARGGDGSFNTITFAEHEAEEDTQDILQQAEDFLQKMEKARGSENTLLLTEGVGMHREWMSRTIPDFAKLREQGHWGHRDMRISEHDMHNQNYVPVTPRPVLDAAACQRKAIMRQRARADAQAVRLFASPGDVKPLWRFEPGEVSGMLSLTVSECPDIEALRCLKTGRLFGRGSQAPKGDYLAVDSQGKICEGVPEDEGIAARQVPMLLQHTLDALASLPGETPLDFDVVNVFKEGQNTTVADALVALRARAHDWESGFGLRASYFTRSLRAILQRLKATFPSVVQDCAEPAPGPVEQDASSQPDSINDQSDTNAKSQDKPQQNDAPSLAMISDAAESFDADSHEAPPGTGDSEPFNLDPNLADRLKTIQKSGELEGACR